MVDDDQREVHDRGEIGGLHTGTCMIWGLRLCNLGITNVIGMIVFFP